MDLFRSSEDAEARASKAQQIAIQQLLFLKISEDVEELERILRVSKGDVMRAANILLESQQWARKLVPCEHVQSTNTQVNKEAPSSTKNWNHKAARKKGSGPLDRAFSEETVGFCERDVLSALSATTECNTKSRVNVYKRFFYNYYALRANGVPRRDAMVGRTKDLPTKKQAKRAAKKDFCKGKHPQGSAWAVIVAGAEGETSNMFNIGAVFDLCVQRMGREHVIVVANVQETHDKLKRAATTGVPAFSELLRPFPNVPGNLERSMARLRRFEAANASILAGGGADYDYERASTESVMRVLTGRPLKAGDKVIPADEKVRSVFFCLAGHGGSFRSVRRNGHQLATIRCDLCKRPHTPRVTRAQNKASTHWLDWQTEDCNGTYIASEGQVDAKERLFSSTKAKLNYARSHMQSAEDDRTLAEEDAVITPFGPGTILSVSSKGPRYNSVLPTTFGAKCWTRCRYTVRLHPQGGHKPGKGGGHNNPCWRLLAILRAFPLLSGGREIPGGVARALFELLGGCGSLCEWVRVCGVRVESGALVLSRARREWMCLSCGPRREDHYHSSLKTREWAFGLPHASPASYYGHVSWRYAYARTPTTLLFWQQLFEGFHSIRNHNPSCRVLCLTEACFSGGAMKFMDDRALCYWRHLETWPLFFVATASEAATSVVGMMNIFIDCVKAARGKAVTIGALVERAHRTFSSFFSKAFNQSDIRAYNQTGKIQISFAKRSGVDREDVSMWFGK